MLYIDCYLVIWQVISIHIFACYRHPSIDIYNFNFGGFITETVTYCIARNIGVGLKLVIGLAPPKSIKGISHHASVFQLFKRQFCLYGLITNTSGYMVLEN